MLYWLLLVHIIILRFELMSKDSKQPSLLLRLFCCMCKSSTHKKDKAVRPKLPAIPINSIEKVLVGQFPGFNFIPDLPFLSWLLRIAEFYTDFGLDFGRGRRVGVWKDKVWKWEFWGCYRINHCGVDSNKYGEGKLILIGRIYFRLLEICIFDFIWVINMK